jgi:hypothetical protein
MDDPLCTLFHLYDHRSSFHFLSIILKLAFITKDNFIWGIVIFLSFHGVLYIFLNETRY